MATLLQHALEIIVSRLPCGCHIPCLGSPPSPALSAQEGELAGLLLDEPTWLDDDDETRTKATRVKQPYGKLASMRRGAKRPDVADDADEEQEGPLEYDPDPSSFGRETLDKLPELARRYEPQFTLEDIEREEREQEERDRAEERATALGKRFADFPRYAQNRDGEVDEDDFGGFAQAPRGAESSMDPLGAVRVLESEPTSGSRSLPEEADAEEDEDEAAEVSFGLGEVDSDDEA